MTQRINFGLYVPASNAMTLHKGHAPPTMDADRICSEHGCATRLSIYNRGEACSVHEPMRPARSRGVRESRARA